MGEISNTINHYLSDNRRFADLFNRICFQGEAVVRAEDLAEGTQVYYRMAQEPEKTGQNKKTRGRKERIRDICKKLKSGGHFAYWQWRINRRLTIQCHTVVWSMMLWNMVSR